MFIIFLTTFSDVQNIYYLKIHHGQIFVGSSMSFPLQNYTFSLAVTDKEGFQILLLKSLSQ